MKMFAKIKDGIVAKFPYGLCDLLAENPTTNFSSTDLAALFPQTTAGKDEGYELVQCRMIYTESYDEFNYRLDDWIASFENGEWITRQKLTPLTNEQKDEVLRTKRIEMRYMRNQLLAQCDWTQLADAPVDKQVWSAYRQALRDVPNQAGFPAKIDWPKSP
jgi:hypothetical protein